MAHVALTSVTLAAWALAVTSVLLVVLIGLVVALKIRRDRSERASMVRRGVFAAALASGSMEGLAPLLSAATRTSAARRDLATVLAREPVSATRGLHLAVRRARLDMLLLEQAEHRDPAERGLAILLSCRLRLPEAVAIAAGRLADDDADVRLAAVAGLEQIGTPAAARALIAGLEQRVLPAERLIERLAGAWAVSELVVALERASHPGDDGAFPPLRASLARALGLVPGARRAETAVLWLLRTGAFEERIAAARALGACGTRRSVPHLLGALEDEAWQLRVQALRSLGTLRAEEAAPRMAEHLADDAWWVRAAAADALRDLGPTGREQLVAALDHPDRYARDRAREALALDRVARDEQVPAPLLVGAPLTWHVLKAS